MYKDHLCTCSQSGMFRTLDSLLTCSGFSGLLLLLPSGMLAGMDPATCCWPLWLWGTNQKVSKAWGWHIYLTIPPHQRSRDLWRAELPEAEQGMDPPAGLALAPAVLPGAQLRLVHLAFGFWTQCTWFPAHGRVGSRWPLKTVPSLWLSIILFRSTDFIRETVGFCSDDTESKRRSI